MQCTAIPYEFSVQSYLRRIFGSKIYTLASEKVSPIHLHHSTPSTIPSSPYQYTRPRIRLRLVGSHSDGVVPSVESDELRFEHDIAIDLEVGGRGLESAEAGYCFVSLYIWEGV